jgi:hypothetical protein
MVASTTLPLVLHAEQEHARLRYTISLLLLVAFVLCFALLYLLIGLTPDPWPSYAVILSCLLSLPLTLVVMWLVEQQLKRVWHSGYQLVLDERGVAVIQPGREPFLLPWDNSLTPLAWYYHLRGYRQLGRERRVPDSWLCLACQLQGNDALVIVYAFAPPQKGAAYLAATSAINFHQLRPAEVYQRSGLQRFQAAARPRSIPISVLSGKDGRYWLAEQRRWAEGLELPFKEFEIFLHYLQTQTRRTHV